MATKGIVKDRTNRQICISFGKDDYDLIQLMDDDRKRENINRSSWFKNRIRERCGTANRELLVY